MLIKLTILYAHSPSVSVRVPDMGLTLAEWGQAVFLATHIPTAHNYRTPGAREVDRALRAGRHSGDFARPLKEGDGVLVSGSMVRCIAVDYVGGVARFSGPEPMPAPMGPMMHVSAETAPPDAVAYVEDRRDRLWTGRGLGTWRCLTDPAGRTAAGSWARVWVEHGPLVPLVPVDVLPEPVGEELASGPHRSGRPMDLPAF